MIVSKYTMPFFYAIVAGNVLKQNFPAVLWEKSEGVAGAAMN